MKSSAWTPLNGAVVSLDHATFPLPCRYCHLTGKPLLKLRSHDFGCVLFLVHYSFSHGWAFAVFICKMGTSVIIFPY